MHAQGETTGFSSGSRQQSADSGDLASPVHSRKRQVDTALEIIPLPAKKTRLTQTNSRQLIEVEKAEQVTKPKPLPLKRPHASFLEDSVGQLPSSPASKRYRPEAVDSFVVQWVESDRERHCRSDTLLGHSDGELIPRSLAKSVGAEPNIAFARDFDGFIMPPKPPRSHSLDPSIREFPAHAASLMGEGNILLSSRGPAKSLYGSHQIGASFITYTFCHSTNTDIGMPMWAILVLDPVHEIGMQKYVEISEKSRLKQRKWTLSENNSTCHDRPDESWGVRSPGVGDNLLHTSRNLRPLLTPRKKTA